LDRGYPDALQRPRSSNIDDLAAACAGAIADRFAHATILLGHSFGGLLAHRVASLLTGKSKPLAVVILGTLTPDLAAEPMRELAQPCAAHMELGDGGRSFFSCFVGPVAGAKAPAAPQRAH